MVSPERLPLGLWETSIEARLDQEHGKASQRKEKPIEQKETYRWLEESPVLGTVRFTVTAKEQFKKVEGGSRKKVSRSRREATQEIRAIQVQLKAPRRKDRRLPAVQIWVVQAKEIDPPMGEEPIHLYVMHLGRQCPDLPCSVVFEQDEWQSTWVIIKGGSPRRALNAK